MYTIVDIETTGSGIEGNKITEIAIFKFDGERVVDEFTSLVNPECEIPYFITGLTGIDNDLVRDAPTFEEIAPKILEITKDAVFVAHSVNFDYNVLKNELKALDLPFVRKKLCTVRLARVCFPGYASYSLGKLCSALSIPLTDRHRARGDAHATLLLFQKITALPNATTIVQRFLNARSQEATLPPLLSRSVYEKLPKKAGVYYFKDGKGKIIYVGKAKNIRQRVLGHFYDKSTKEVHLCRATSTIDFELSGSELVALLMETAAIKRHFPLFNRAQKKNVPQYGIFSFEDRQGIMHLAYNRLKLVSRPLITFPTTSDCRSYLEQLCVLFQLCPKYCHLQENVAQCSHFRIQNCKGVCRHEEAVDEYNQRVQLAVTAIQTGKENFIIKEKGRHAKEEAVVLMQDGLYSGYGFLPNDISVQSIEDVLAFIEPQKNTLEALRLIQSYKAKYPEAVIEFN